MMGEVKNRIGAKGKSDKNENSYDEKVKEFEEFLV